MINDLIVFDIMKSGPSFLSQFVIVSPPSVAFVYSSCLWAVSGTHCEMFCPSLQIPAVSAFPSQTDETKAVNDKPFEWVRLESSCRETLFTFSHQAHFSQVEWISLLVWDGADKGGSGVPDRQQLVCPSVIISRTLILILWGSDCPEEILCTKTVFYSLPQGVIFVRAKGEHCPTEDSVQSVDELPVSDGVYEQQSAVCRC